MLVGGVGFDNDFLSSVDFNQDILAGGSGFDSAVADTLDTATSVESISRRAVGVLGEGEHTLRADAAGKVTLPLRWTHPKAWRSLKTIDALLYDGAKQVGRVTLRPASGRITGTGAAKGAKGTLTHKGKTVSARVKLHLPARSTAGRSGSTSGRPTRRATPSSRPRPGPSAADPADRHGSPAPAGLPDGQDRRKPVSTPAAQSSR